MLSVFTETKSWGWEWLECCRAASNHQMVGLLYSLDWRFKNNKSLYCKLWLIIVNWCTCMGLWDLCITDTKHCTCIEPCIMYTKRYVQIDWTLKLVVYNLLQLWLLLRSVLIMLPTAEKRNEKKQDAIKLIFLSTCWETIGTNQYHNYEFYRTPSFIE